MAVLEKGILLRELGVDNPILVMGGIWGNQIPAYIQHNLTLTAPSVERLEQIEQADAVHGTYWRPLLSDSPWTPGELWLNLAE